jgi:hypothetical protein
VFGIGAEFNSSGESLSIASCQQVEDFIRLAVVADDDVVVVRNGRIHGIRCSEYN